MTFSRPMTDNPAPDYRVWEDKTVEVGPADVLEYYATVPSWFVPRQHPFRLVLADWVRPRRGDLIEPLEHGPFLDKGRLYVCTDVRESRGGWDRTTLVRVEFSSTKSPSGKIFGPPVDRFAVALRHVSLSGQDPRW